MNLKGPMASFNMCDGKLVLNVVLNARREYHIVLDREHSDPVTRFRGLKSHRTCSRSLSLAPSKPGEGFEPREDGRSRRSRCDLPDSNPHEALRSRWLAVPPLTHPEALPSVAPRAARTVEPGEGFEPPNSRLQIGCLVHPSSPGASGG